jgi:hypothetical protein
MKVAFHTFVHYLGLSIEDDRMSYEPIEYPNKKIIMSKNVQ